MKSRISVVADEPADDVSPSVGTAVRVDGYLERPLREGDVLARVAAALGTQADTAEAAPELLRFAGYTLDITGRRCLDASNGVVALTRAEFSLLLCLASRPGIVVSRDDLARAVAGREVECGDRSVDVLISRLRRKIEVDRKSPQMISPCRVSAMCLPRSRKPRLLHDRQRIVLHLPRVGCSHSTTAPEISPISKSKFPID